MADDSQSKAKAPSQHSEALEICSNCGQRILGLQPHDCAGVTADFAAVGSAAPPASPSSSSVHSAEAGLIGRILGNDQYLVLERISQGGMGVVYKARHIQLASLVAVKVLHDDADPSFQQRFLREAQLAAKVKHPNIVYISDFGVLPDGGSFLVMEYLEGKTLTQAMSGFRLDPRRALRIAMQLVHGMLAAHEQGIIHRDLKPANIFLIEKPGVPETLKIIDFGIAKGLVADGIVVPPSGAWTAPGPLDRLAADELQKTMSSLIGTPGYMAPEQIRGSPTDARADQYAIGCILYLMLTGTPVFTSKAPQDLLLMHLVESAESPRKRLPELTISNEMEELLLRLLAKEPEDRYPSLREVEAELAIELTQIESGQQSPLSQISFRSLSASQLSFRTGNTEVLVPPPPPPRRRRTLRWVLSIGLTALLAGAGLVFFTTQPPRPPPVVQIPQITVEEVQRLRVRALSVLSEQTRHSDSQVRHGALEALGQSHEGQAFPILQEIYESGTEVDQAEALQAMGQLGEREAVPLLETALREAKPPAVQWAAAQALMALGEESGVQFIERGLTNGDRQSQLRVALLLCERGHPLATERLSALLEGAKVPDVFLLAGLSCQARAGQTQARERLLARMRDTANAGAQLAAAAKLNQLGDAAGRALLSRMAKHPGPQQLVAARLLAAPNEPSGADLFRTVLRDLQAEPAARQVAIEGLGACGQPNDLWLLEPLLDPQTPLALRQSTAGSTLRVVGRDVRLLSPHSLSWARAAIGDANWLVRHSAVSLIAESEAPDSLTILVQSLRDSRPEIRLQAVRALGKSRSMEALRGLATTLRDSDRPVRRASGRAILRVADTMRRTSTSVPEATAWFRELLKTGSSEEQTVARTALTRLGDPTQGGEIDKSKAVPSPTARPAATEPPPEEPRRLSSLLQDPDLSVRSIAAQRLADLGDRRSLPALNESLKRGGSDAARAYAAILRLGETGNRPQELEGANNVEQIGQRMAQIEEARQLPRQQAVHVLVQAANDSEPFVRRLVAEVAADLTDGKPDSPLMGLLTRLSQDPAAIVRGRAVALISRARASAAASARSKEPSAAADMSENGRPAEPNADLASPPDGSAAPASSKEGPQASPSPP